MARKIVVTSGKGGVGKTTLVANLGYALAGKGLKVLLMDADIGLNNLDVVLGLENKVVYDLIDVLNGRCRPRQALLQDFFVDSLYVLPSNHAYLNLDVDGQGIKEIVDQLDDFFDYILIDCPAGIEGGFFRAINTADEAIVVTTSHLSSIRDVNKVINILHSYKKSIIGVVINRVRGDLVLNQEMLSVDEIARYLNLPVLGAIPEDDCISFQLLSGKTLKQRSEACLAFGCIVDNLHNGSNKVYDCTKKYKGFLGSLKKSVRRWV